jgi:acyl carrier protein
MHNIDAIYQELTPIFQNVFDDDEIVPHPAMSAADVDEWDSLSHIRLVVAIEQAFGVKFTTAELVSLETVGHMVALVKEKMTAS